MENLREKHPPKKSSLRADKITRRNVILQKMLININVGSFVERAAGEFLKVFASCVLIFPKKSGALVIPKCSGDIAFL